MAIAEDIYARCRLCCVSAATILEEMVIGNTVDRVAVAARRPAADIAGDTAAALLRRTFITPVEREDLWRLRSQGERLWQQAENAALVAYHRRKAGPLSCHDVLRAAATVCAEIAQAWEPFPHHAVTAPSLRQLREAQRLCHTALHQCQDGEQLCDAVLAVLEQAETVLDTLQYIHIKNA